MYYAIGSLDTAREQHLAQVARIELTGIENDCLWMILKKGSDWRGRERAETVLLLASGKTVKGGDRATEPVPRSGSYSVPQMVAARFS